MIKKIIASLEYLFVILSLILYTGGVLDIVAIDGFSEGDGVYNMTISANEKLFVVKQILFYVTYIISSILLMRMSDKSTKITIIFLRNIHVSLLVGLTVISTIWSELPAQTISRSIALVGTTIFGIYLANRYTLKEQLILLRNTFLAIVILSIIFVITIPQYGVMGAIHDGAWRGIYTHKNELGRLMSLGAIVFSMQSRQEGETKIIGLKSRSIGKLKQYIPTGTMRDSFLQSAFTLLGLGATIAMILLSRSSGGIVNLTIMASALAIFKISQLRGFHLKFVSTIGVVVLIVIFAVIILPNPELIFALIGKSSDLTGRGDLWNVLLDLLSNRPLLGFGYGVFWESYGAIVSLAVAWDVPHAHNGFLDLTLGVGLLGLALFSISYLSTFAKSLAQFRSSQSDESIYPSIILIYIVISNVSETGLFSYNNIYWLLFVTVSHSMILSTKKNILPPNPQFF